jgi:HEAT repeat protein
LVRAAVAEQLRNRNVPGAVSLLIELLDSRHEAERAAAEACLAEFRFPRYLAAFNSLPPDVRVSTGMLVKRIDPQTLELVRHELTAPLRAQRKRGLELVVALDAVADLRDSIATLLSDEDPFLRIETIRVLASDDSVGTRNVLRQVLLDKHPLVRETAEAALRQLAGPSPTEGVGTVALSDTTPLSALLPAISTNPYVQAGATTGV